MKSVPSLKHKLAEYKKREMDQDNKMGKNNWKSIISIKPMG